MIKALTIANLTSLAKFESVTLSKPQLRSPKMSVIMTKREARQKLIKTMVSNTPKKTIRVSNQKISEHDPVKALQKTIERQKIHAPQIGLSSRKPRK